MILFHRLCIYGQGPFTRFLMTNYRRRVAEVFPFRHPVTNIVEVRVKPFGLQRRIENPKIRRCITAAAGSPLPAPIVGCQVKIQELLDRKSVV